MIFLFLACSQGFFWDLAHLTSLDFFQAILIAPIPLSTPKAMLWLYWIPLYHPRSHHPAITQEALSTYTLFKSPFRYNFLQEPLSDLLYLG